VEVSHQSEPETLGHINNSQHNLEANGLQGLVRLRPRHRRVAVVALRVVIVHNRYRSANPSGENRVVDADIEQLVADGVDVHTYLGDSDEIDSWSAIRKSGLAIRPTYSPTDVRRFRGLLRRVKPHVVHLHNPFPIISPAIVRVAKSEGVPVVQTVHNFRHSCVNGIQFREGALCTECVGRTIPWPAIKHGCYQDSRLAAFPMALAQVAHRSTWRMVDRFLPVGEGVAESLRNLGLHEAQILVRPNVVEDPGEPAPLGDGALYVGRLSEEKGIRLLLAAWKMSGLGTKSTLSIAGAGNLLHLVEKAAETDPSVRYLGCLDKPGLKRAYAAAALVVVPSICLEADPLSVISALAHGRAVLATNTGAIGDYLGEDSGWLASPDEQSICAVLVESLMDPGALQKRGTGARRLYTRTRYPRSQTTLGEIYDEVSYSRQPS